jgi:hypothetical protein
MKSGDLPGFGWMPTIDPSKAATGSLHVQKRLALTNMKNDWFLQTKYSIGKLWFCHKLSS